MTEAKTSIGCYADTQERFNYGRGKREQDEYLNFLLDLGGILKIDAIRNLKSGKLKANCPRCNAVFSINEGTESPEGMICPNCTKEQQGTEKDAALVEAAKPEAISAEGSG